MRSIKSYIELLAVIGPIVLIASSCTKHKDATPPAVVAPPVVAREKSAMPAPSPTVSIETRVATQQDLNQIRTALCYDPSFYRCYRYALVDSAKSVTSQETKTLCWKAERGQFCVQYIINYILRGSPDSNQVNEREIICRYNSPTGEELQYNSNSDQTVVKGLFEKCVSNAKLNSR